MLSLAVIAYFSTNDRNRVSEVAGYGLAFPDLIGQLNEVAAIHMTAYDNKYQVVLAHDEWQVSAYHGYPARSEVVANFLLGWAQLRKVEPKTNDPDNFESLHLIGTNNEKSPTIELHLQASDNRKLASLLIGKRQPSVRSSLLTEVFIRHPLENQTWLAESGISIPGTAIEWLDTEIIDLDEEIQQVSVVSPDHPPFRVMRDPDQTEKFKLVELPENHTIRYQFKLNGVGEFFRRLHFEDVRRGAAPATGISVTAHTTDNLVITATLGEGEHKNFAYFSARTTDAASFEVINKAEALNRKWSQWLYRISDIRRQTAELTIAELVEPLNSANAQHN